MNKKMIKTSKGEVSMYIPDCPSIALIHIFASLGQGEEYYENLIQFMLEGGVIVCFSPYIPENTFELDRAFVENIAESITVVRKRLRTIPYFAYGHGMSSLALTAAAMSNENLCDALILSGFILEFDGQKYAKKLRYAIEKGNKKKADKLLSKIYSMLSKNSTDPDHIYKYSPYEIVCISDLICYIFSENIAKALPHGIPTLFASGKNSRFSARIKTEADMLKDHEMTDVNIKIYPCSAESILFGRDETAFTVDMLEFITSSAEDIHNLRRMM